MQTVHRRKYICDSPTYRSTTDVDFKQQLINAPDSATLLTSTPCSLAMKPSTEKMAKPEYRLVQLLITVSTIQLLSYMNIITVYQRHGLLPTPRRLGHSFVSFIFVQNKQQTPRLNKSVEQDNKAYSVHLRLPKVTINMNYNT